MMPPPAARSWIDAPWLRRLPFRVGVLIKFLGLVVMLGWIFHWTPLVQVLPNLPTMKFNTALGFTLAGAAMILLARRRKYLPAALGGLVFLLGALTWLEYLGGRDPGLDQFFAKDFLRDMAPFPGRMSQLSASCFVLVGLGLMSASLKHRGNRWLAAVGLASCVVMVVAGVALAGFLIGIADAHSWGAYTQMALHTAAAFLLLGGGLFIWSWQESERARFNFLRWVPVIGSVTLMAMIAVTAAMSLADLKNAIFWRGHTYEVLNNAQAFVGSLTDTQRGMRGYLLTTMPEALELYRSATNAAPHQLGHMVELTHDSAVQQGNLKVLANDLAAVIGYSRSLIGIRDTQGLAAAIELEKTGRGLHVMNRARADLDVFTQEEQRLLVARDATAANNFNNTTHLFVFGSALAGALLLLANFMASREVRRREQAEEMQRKLNVRLLENLQLQNAMLGSANYAIISTTTTGVVTTFNAAAEHWLGYTAAEIVGKTTPALWHDPAEVAARARVLSEELGRKIEPGFAAFTAKAELGGVDENEWTLIRRDGGRFSVSLSATALLDATGGITGYLGVLADITERKEAGEKLHRQQAELRMLFDIIPALICFKDTKNRIVRANRRLAEPLGLTVAEVEGKKTEELYPQDAAKYFADDLEVIESGTPKLGIIETFQDANQRPVWIMTDKVPVRDTNGKVSGLVVMSQDITESRRAQEALRLSEERLRLATEAADVGVWAWDVKSGALQWDEKIFAIYGMDPKPGGRLEYADWSATVLPEDLAAAEAQLQLTVSTGGSSKREFRIRRVSDQSVRIIYAAETVSVGLDGRADRVVGINLDITERKQMEAALQASELRYRSLFENMVEGYAYCRLLYDAQGQPADFIYLEVNSAFEGQCGLRNVIGKKITELIPDIWETNPEIFARYHQVVSSSVPMNYENFVKSLGVWLSVTLYSYEQEHFVAVFENITERKLAAAKLAANEALLREFIRHAPVAIAMLDTQMRYVQTSDRWLQDYHLDGRNLIGRSHYDVFPRGLARWKEVHERVLAGAIERCAEDPVPLDNGTTEWLQWEARPWQKLGGGIGGLIFFTQNITARKRAEEKVAESLREKEALLREIHHRVKNNMQVISSILQLQSGYIKDALALEVFRDCQNRIRTMALIHEKLYRSDGLAQIDFKEYLESLVSLLLRSQATKGVALKHELQIEPVTLDMDTAIPLGLIANELVSNCLKHAFTGRPQGLMRVALRKNAGGGFQLVVQDDGHGLPPEFDPEKTNSLGVRLVKILTSQIKGTMTFKNAGGAEFAITFGQPASPIKK